MEFLNYNGRIIASKDFCLTIDNRSFRYGDGLFESIKYINGYPLLYQLHYNRLQNGMSVLSLKADPKFELEQLLANIQETVNSNKVEDPCRIRISVFRESGGFYTPEKSDASYIIECMEMDKSNSNNAGISLGIYREIPKPINLLSNLKTSNSLIFVMAGIYKDENNFDDVILLNEKGNIVEAISSNIFLVLNNEFLTPSLSEGCIQGVQREHLIEKIKMEGMVVTEKEITLKDLRAADEVFLTNAIQGISWVGRSDERSYGNQMTSKLIEMVNQP